MSKKESKTSVEEFRERLEREDIERHWKLEVLDRLFTESQRCPEKFHQQWVKPLIGAGVNLETALSLLVEGWFRPN
jgi:predicted transcriptional regulator